MDATSISGAARHQREIKKEGERDKERERVRRTEKAERKHQTPFLDHRKRKIVYASANTR